MLDVRNVKLEFKKEKSPNTIPKYLILILIVFMGSFGVLFNITVSPEISFSPFNVWVAIFSATLIYCLIGILPGKLKLMYLLEIFVFLSLVFIKHKDIWYGISAITNSLLKVSGEEYRNNVLTMFEIDAYTTTALCFFMFFIATCMCFFTLTWNNIFGMVIPVVFLAVPLYFSLEPPLIGLLFTMLYIVAVGILNSSSFYQYTGKKESLFVKYGTFFYPKSKNSFITVITPLLIGIVIASAIMSISFRTDFKRSEKMNEQYYSLQEVWNNSDGKGFWGSLKDVSEVLFTTDGGGPSSERISGINHGDRLGTVGDLKQSDGVAIEVMFELRPRGSVYLKGYVGSVYEGNSWIDFDTKFYNSPEYNRFNNAFIQANMFPQTQAIYYLLSYGRADNMKLTCKLEENNISYVPYYFASGGDDSQEFYVENDTLITSKNPNEYICTFMEGTFDNSTMSMFVNEGHFNLPMDADYYEFVKKNAATVPNTPEMEELRNEFVIEKGIPTYEEKLNENADNIFRDENGTWLGGISEELYLAYLEEYEPQTPYSATFSILNKIKTVITEDTKYSLSPGVTPIDEDFIHYFLTEQKEGYCSYYASAGTMLARMCGIPARYVEGYIVQNSEITELDSPTIELGESYLWEYKSNVLGKNAHAWTEVYIDGLGWIPFEFTPGFSDGETPPSEDSDGSDSTSPQAATTTPPANSNSNNNVTTTPPPSSSRVTSYVTDVKSENASSEDKFDWLIFVPIALGIVLAVGSVLLRRHIFARRRILAMTTEYTNINIIAAYGYISDLLEFVGIVRGDADYFDFARSVDFENMSFEFDKEEFMVITKLASKAKFSDHVLTEEESRRVIGFANELAKSIYDGLKFYGRVGMAYGRGLI
jgi:hypothetical protein